MLQSNLRKANLSKLKDEKKRKVYQFDNYPKCIRFVKIVLKKIKLFLVKKCSGIVIRLIFVTCIKK